MHSEYNIVLNTNAFRMTDKEFALFCSANRDLRIERDTHSNIIIMSPVLDPSSELNLEVASQLRDWNKKNKTGKVFDSSAGFTLNNNAVRSPDVTWIAIDNYKAARKKQGTDKGFLKVAPDFVIEIKSESDTVDTLKSKISEYLDNGVRLAYLINPDDKTCLICSGEKTEQKKLTEKIIATDVVPGFELDLAEFFAANQNI